MLLRYADTRRFPKRNWSGRIIQVVHPSPVRFCTWPQHQGKKKPKKDNHRQYYKRTSKTYHIHADRLVVLYSGNAAELPSSMEWGRWIDLSDILWPHLLCMDMYIENCMLRETCATFLTVGYNFIAPHTTYPWNESSYVCIPYILCFPIIYVEYM